VNLQSWPTELLESLGCLLLRVLPTASDPDTAGRIVSITPTTQLRDTRGRVVYLLCERHTPESEAALERLSAIDAGVRNQVQSHCARAAARALVETLPEAPSSGSSAAPLEHAIRLLDKEEFRLVRSSDDLLEAVQAALEAINKEVAHDLSLLYGSPPRRQRSRTKSSNREHLKEDALQAYVRRRLADLMPRFVPFVKVEFVREPQMGRRRRLDLQVLAQCHQQETLAKVVIECKWSDHTGMKKSMVKQLAKYLIDEQLTHGIYLVGWCGRWSTSKPGDRRSRSALEVFLRKQRDESRRHPPGSGLRIEPVVIPLEWTEPTEGDRL
jgi:hypothetical protein